MKKQIANIITGSRIILSLPLLFIHLSSVCFYMLYLFCGLTDMVDGTIARKMGAVSQFGARLDTVADFVFLLACGIKVLPLIPIPTWLWGWVITVALIKLFYVAWVFIRKKKLVSIHSVLNKITGLALFLFPLTLPLVEPVYSVAIVCLLATVAAMQEGYLIAKGQES